MSQSAGSAPLTGEGYANGNGMNELCDEILVAQTRTGETKAFGELVARYENTARVVALRYHHHHHSAEDAVQQAFLTAFEQLATLRDPRRFGPWLLRIVQREAQAQRRRAMPTTLECTNIPQRTQTFFIVFSVRVRSNAEYHYLASAEVLARIGKAFGEAVAHKNAQLDRF